MSGSKYSKKRFFSAFRLYSPAVSQVQPGTRNPLYLPPPYKSMLYSQYIFFEPQQTQIKSQVEHAVETEPYSTESIHVFQKQELPKSLV